MTTGLRDYSLSSVLSLSLILKYPLRLVEIQQIPQILYNKHLPLAFICIAPVFRSKRPGFGRWTQEHFGDFDPVSAIVTRQQSLCDNIDNSLVCNVLFTYPNRFGHGRQGLDR